MAEEITFRDHFSQQAALYAAARPSYPDELYRFIASLAPGRRIAWDCATGNGQAAHDLARFFDRVIATDASAEQISLAVAESNVGFRVARADDSGIEAGTVDVVTVAQALHWFAGDPFFAEVRRVTVPGGLIAAWSYGACHAGADIEATLREFEHHTLGLYWSPERRWVDEQYRTIPFPFPEVAVPAFELRVRWTLRQLGAYLGSWSAVASFRRERGEDPVPPILARLAANWGDSDSARDITWPLNLRVGRVE